MMGVLRKVTTLGFSGDDRCFAEESQPLVSEEIIGVLRGVATVGFWGDNWCF